MYIYDSNSDRTIDDVVLYLTPDEAKELYDDLAKTIEQPRGNHAHVNNSAYDCEITVCVYREEDMDSFDEKSRQILKGD